MKSITDQVGERLRRAEEQLPLYQIRITRINARTHTGQPVHTAVFYVTSPKGTVYTVTGQGCNCQDSLKARAEGLQRPCKHTLMTDLYLARYTFTDELPEDPAPFQSDDERADEVMEEISARRAQVRRRMQQDFPAD